MPETNRPYAGPTRRPRQRPAWRTIAGIVAVLLAAGLIAFILSRCAAAGGSGPGGGRGRPSITVGVAQASLGDVPITLAALGTVTPEATVQVTSKVGGTLNAVNFTEGQLVRRGALLASIDPQPFRVPRQQAQGQMPPHRPPLPHP